MPTGLIEKQDGVGAWHDRPGDFRQMQCHGGGVAEGQDEARAGSPCWANGAEDVGRARPLIVRRRWPRPAPCPSPCDLVLLPDPGFVLEPDFYRLARPLPLRDLCQVDGELFLNPSSASVFWALCRGRAESFRKPMARNSRLSVCLLIETRDSSNTHCAR